MSNARALCVVPLAIAAAILAAPAVNADRPEPVPLFGSYDTFLDHSRQTFNGQPNFSDPSVQAASFTTTCVASGCVAHWLRLTELAENPNAHGCCGCQLTDTHFTPPSKAYRRQVRGESEIHIRWRCHACVGSDCDQRTARGRPCHCACRLLPV